MNISNPDILLKKRILPFAFFGNALEFYEFTIYAIFAPLFANEFFIVESEALSLIYSWAVFAVAFFTRPLGAFVFGYIGDKLGRKIALSFSILSMASATLAIGFLPTYHNAGIFAPIALITLRMIQGVSTGGEYNGAAIYLIEKFKYKKAGLIGGISMSSCVIGSLIGTIFGEWCFMNDMWRIAFIVGGIFGIILFFLRFMLTDSITISNKEKVHHEESLPRHLYISKFISNIAIAGFNGSLSYTLFGFSIMYLTRYIGYSPEVTFNINILGMTMFFLSNPVWGYVYDKLLTKYWNLIVPFNMLMIFIDFYLINHSYSGAIFGMMMLGIQAGSIAGPSHAFFQEGIHSHIRYRFVSVSCSVGMAVIGGITPAVLTSLIGDGEMLYAPAYWVLGLGIITLLIYNIMYYIWNKHKVGLITQVND